MNDIRVRLRLRQSQASQHLKVLKDVGLVEMEPRAQQRLYSLRAEPLKQLHDWLDRYRHIWEERFEALDEIVEELKQKGRSDEQAKTDSNAVKNGTIVERTSDRELVADRVQTQFVGTAKTVADQLEILREATGADELIVTTITHEHADRVRSYELLAEEWAAR